MGVLSVTLSGGECMCHPKFKEYLRAAKNYDFYVNILSNLTLLDDEIIEIMKEGNVSSVQTSLYSMIPEHHDAITQFLQNPRQHFKTHRKRFASPCFLPYDERQQG